MLISATAGLGGCILCCLSFLGVCWGGVGISFKLRISVSRDILKFNVKVNVCEFSMDYKYKRYISLFLPFIE